MQYLIVLGNVVSGFTFYGPFDSCVEANDYAINGPDMENDHDWSIASLVPPPSSWTTLINRTDPRCLWCGRPDHPTIRGFGRTPAPGQTVLRLSAVEEGPDQNGHDLEPAASACDPRKDAAG